MASNNPTSMTQRQLIASAKSVVKGTAGIINQVLALYNAGWTRQEIVEVGYRPGTVNRQIHEAEVAAQQSNRKRNRDRSPAAKDTRGETSSSRRSNGSDASRTPAGRQRSIDLSAAPRRGAVE